MWSRTLFAAILIAAFVTWYALPGESGPREGRALCDFDLTGMGPGERVALGFPVREAYDALELNYNFTDAAKVRAALTGPDGVRHEAIPNVATNTLDLEVTDPPTGDWRLDVWTLADPPGHLEEGRIFILGYGGTLGPEDRTFVQGCGRL